MTHLFTVTALLAVMAAPQAGPLGEQIARDEARRHYRAGEVLVSEEAFEDAVREFRAATELDPAFALAYYSLGQTLMVLKRYPEAAAAYTSSRQVLLDESHLDQRAQAALERERLDEINELEDSLQKVRSGKLKVEDSFRYELPIEERLRFLREAEQRGVESMVRIPAELSLALGSAHFRLGELEPAEEGYRAALRANNRLGAAHNNLAVLCMMTDRLDEARQHVRQAEEAGFRVDPRFKAELSEKIATAQKE